MRWLMALLFLHLALHMACGRTELDLPRATGASCQTDETCPTGLTCASGSCVLPDDNPSVATGGGGDTGNQTPSIGTGGSWGGTQEPAAGGAAGDPSSPVPSGGGGDPVSTESSGGAGAMAGMPGGGNAVAGSSSSRSSSVAGQTGSAGASVGGRPSVAGTTSIVGGSGGASRTSSSSSRTNGEITFAYGQAQGLMTGWAWVAMGKDDLMISPTCDAGRPITYANPCTTATKWITLDSLCMSGSIPALPASPIQADYDNNWGMEIGVNAQEPPDAIGSAMSSFSTVTFNFSGIPRSGVRAFVHRKGDPDGITYCFDSIASGKTFSLTKFNTKCWGDTTTVLLTSADLPKIDKIGIMVSSTSSAITVNGFCLERITFN